MKDAEDSRIKKGRMEMRRVGQRDLIKQSIFQMYQYFSHFLFGNPQQLIQLEIDGRSQSKNLEFGRSVVLQTTKIQNINGKKKQREDGQGDKEETVRLFFAVITSTSLIIWMGFPATPPSRTNQSVYDHFVGVRRDHMPSQSQNTEFSNVLTGLPTKPSIFPALKQYQTHMIIQITCYMKNSPSFCMLLALLLLLHHPVIALNWQGTGQLTNDNLTLIWAYIQANLAANSSSGSLKAFTIGLSDQLNTAWDPAWNVVTVKYSNANPTYNDVLVYGYAFRNHWMWFNGYKTPSINTPFSFVIWKDYNCHEWKFFGTQVAVSDQQTGFTNPQILKIRQIISTYQNLLFTDPWELARSIVEEVQASSEFVTADDRAYSGVLQQQNPKRTQVHARVCAVGKEYYDTYRHFSSQSVITVSGTTYGRLILFRTR